MNSLNSRAGISTLPPGQRILVHLVIINESWFIVAVRRRCRRAECNRPVVIGERRLQLCPKRCLAQYRLTHAPRCSRRLFREQRDNRVRDDAHKYAEREQGENLQRERAVDWER